MKKNLVFNGLTSHYYLKKISRIMRLTVFLILVAAFTVNANTVKSQSLKLTINFENASLAEALDKIENQLSVGFLIPSDLLKDQHKINMSFKDAPLETVLMKILDSDHYGYKLVGNNVVITRKIAEQPLSIKGRVTNSSGEPIIGVTVSIKGTTQGTITNLDGVYELENIPPDAELVFSFVGMKTQTIPVEGKSRIDVVMTEDRIGIEEVVAIGYGTARKEELTSSVFKVTPESFQPSAVNNPIDLIKGKVPGLTIVNQAGNDPNSTPQVNLRGIGTISANNEPLIIIDGVYGTISDLNMLNPNDIESFNVLKDGASAAIYGTRGSNGVIIVDTKSGLRDTSALEYNSYFYFEKPRRNPQVLNADQYLEVMRRLGYKTDQIDKGYNTNWIDQLMSDKLSSYHSLSFMNSSKKSDYRISIGYKDANGIILNTYNKSANFRLNFNNEINKWLKINGIVGGSRINQRFTNYSALDEAMKYDPTAPVYNPDGTFYEYPGVGPSNPVALLDQVNNSAINSRLNASLRSTFTINPELNLSIKGSSFIKDTENTFFEDIDSRNSVFTGIPGTATKGASFYIENVFESLVNYYHNFNKNSIKAMGGYSFIENTLSTSSMTNRGFVTNSLGAYDIGSGSYLTDGKATMESNKETSRLIAFFGRFNYSYAGKYLLNLSVRREGSSVFGVNNKWGWFPAISGAWRLTKEPFMKNLSFINELKIRAGFGITGRSQGIPNYQSLARIGADGNAYYDNTWITTYGPVSNPNPFLRWERSKEFNVGTDFTLFNNNVSGSIDVYSRVTADLLGVFNTQTPPSLEPTIFTNVGTVKNQGIELSLSFPVLHIGEFSWNSSLTYAYNKNEVVSLSNGNFGVEKIPYQDYGNVAASLYILTQGIPIGTFYGYKFDRIDDNGKWVFQDLNHDGKIEENIDYTYLGSGLPKHNYSLSGIMHYKKIDLSFNFIGAAGFKVFNEKRLWYENTANSPSNYLVSILDNTNSKLHDRLRFSDYYLENGDYLRLDNVSLGYNLKIRNVIHQMRIYTTVTNIMLLTKYSGIDPEVGSGTGDGLTPGWDTRSFYPRSSTFLFGIDIKF